VLSVNRNDLIKKLPWLIVLAAIALVGYRIPFGFNLEDEGFYLASSARYLFGDRPFVDEVYTVMRSFDLFLAPLMKISPWDSVLFWRWVGFGIQLGFLALVIRSLCPFLEKKQKILLVFALILFSPYNLWTIYYGNLGTGLVAAGICLWLYAASLKNKTGGWIGFFGGFLFSACVVAYTPMVVMSFFPALALFFWRRAGMSADSIRATRAWLVGFVTGCTCIAVAFFAFRLAGPFFESLNDMRSLHQYKSNPFKSLAVKFIFSGYLKEFLYVFSFFFGIGFLEPRMGGRYRKYFRSAVVLGLVICVCLFIVDAQVFKTKSPALYFFNVILVALALGQVMAHRLKNETQRLASWMLYAAVTFFLILPMFSSNSLAHGNVAIWLLWPAVAAVLNVFPGNEENKKWNLAILALMGICAFSHLYGWVYWDEPIPQLTASFNSPKLRGIKSTPLRVGSLDALLTELTPRVSRGDFLLTYGLNFHSIAGLTYLTDTRPPLRTTILFDSSEQNPSAKKWLQRMDQLGRIPRFAVTLDSTRGAIGEYITTYYDREKSIDIFQLWKRKK
jgi:hypothetical protein